MVSPCEDNIFSPDARSCLICIPVPLILDITINPEFVSPIKAPNTKRTQTMTQDSIAVRPSALGMFVVIVLKILTRTRNTVINRVILKHYSVGSWDLG